MPVQDLFSQLEAALDNYPQRNVVIALGGRHLVGPTTDPDAEDSLTHHEVWARWRRKVGGNSGRRRKLPSVNGGAKSVHYGGVKAGHLW